MSTTKSEAKIEAWVRQMEEGILETRQSVILSYVRNNPNTTIHEIRTKLEIPHQTTTAVVSMLMDVGLLRFNGKIKLRDENDDEKGDTYSMLVYVADENERKAVKKQRKQDKFIAWAKKGVSEFKEFISPQTFFELGKNANTEETKVIEGDLTSLLR